PLNGEKRRPSILIVDDEHTIREMLEDIFSDHHFKVHTAGDGKEGVELFKQHKDNIDLVILDMVMPQMGGKEAFAEIRALK
ncbi:MAG: response regulator, partial [Calditrichota bacterium]